MCYEHLCCILSGDTLAHSEVHCFLWVMLYLGLQSIAMRKLRIIIPGQVWLTICKEESQQQYSCGKHLISFPLKKTETVTIF